MGTSHSTPPSYALIVEGNVLLRLDIATILEDAGFRVLDVATAYEASEILRQHGREFALLFTALKLGEERDGTTLAHTTASNYPHISIMVASGSDKPEPGELPATALFIAKPFSAKIIYQHLKQIMPNDWMPAPLNATKDQS